MGAPDRYTSLHLSPALLAAAGSSARASGLSRHRWILAGLDAAAGLAPLPRGYQGVKAPAPADARDYRRDGDVTLRTTAEQVAAYERAATATWLSVSTWAAVVIAVLAGVSELPIQIKRLRTSRA